ncbi:hypothetical protein N7474_005780 [Penicillium riverlandense]|uniref:uncharacterized protein n=1 Tax=Penicillium riverlandense TaxID=1903569 RepID=UPI002547931A|nr:uncharacterized protein N7474_005780 [Penicillium riverlandense]KAJ5820189.1 hypothetical protein N7474_005780 [Penicillium riverlandense]
MSTTSALQTRLKELSSTLSEIQPLVDRLRTFTASIGQGDEARVELGSEIHARVKEAEEELELLRVEVEALDSGANDRRRRSLAGNGDKEAEKERVVALAGRLAADLKRCLLLSRPKSPPGDGQRRPSEKLTQGDLERNASNDVTAALRRTHQLMQAELSRSQFAQETLEQSTAAISSLSESYTSLDTLLASSRSLASSLLHSQKSDTWYLETAFYLLVGTITWLLFRRILYGPMWWLVWLPVKFVARLVFAVLGAGGLSSTAVQSASSPLGDITTTLHESATAVVSTAVTGSGVAESEKPSARDDEDSMIDKIGKMAEESDRPRNTKKRMYEEEPDDPHRFDEL